MQYCESIKKFNDALTSGEILLGIDYGQVKIGLSVSDQNWIMALPYITIKNHSDIANEIAAIVKEKKVGGIVIGYPLDLSGSVGETCKKVAEFTAKLDQVMEGMPYFYQDERFSTKAARNFLSSTNLTRKKQDAIDDMLAASNILQTVLEMLAKFR